MRSGAARSAKDRYLLRLIENFRAVLSLLRMGSVIPLSESPGTP